MSTDEWDDLARLAQAATAGEWAADRYGGGWQVSGAGTVFADAQALREDAEFIAAANPATILHLIAEVDRLRSVIKGHEAAAGALIDERDALAVKVARIRYLIVSRWDTYTDTSAILDELEDALIADEQDAS